MQTVEVRSRSRVELIDVTSKVRDAITKSGVRDGIAVVFVTHTTAAVTINEAADPAVPADIINKLSQLVPRNGSYQHTEGNSDAHIKSSLVGSSVNLVVVQGSPVLGTWQGVFLCEFDGPRNRKLAVQVVPGG
jgi:secondary thiamine-phosphate synthase enzyme